MILEDEDALICDLAETYGIYDYRSMPPKLIATLAAGLRYNSRTMMKASGERIEENRMILFSILDSVRLLVWMNTQDGQKNRRRPKSIVQDILDRITGPAQKGQYYVFDSPEAFERARADAVERYKKREVKRDA